MTSTISINSFTESVRLTYIFIFMKVKISQYRFIQVTFHLGQRISVGYTKDKVDVVHVSLGIKLLFFLKGFNAHCSVGSSYLGFVIMCPTLSLEVKIGKVKWYVGKYIL